MKALTVCQVSSKGVLGGDRHRLELEIEVAWIDALCAIAQQRSEGAGDEGAQLRVAQRGKRPDRLDAARAQPGFGAWADSGQEPHRERSEELGFLPGRDDCETTRLPPVRADLADHLRGAHAERARQTRPAPHRSLNGRCDSACAREVGRDGAEVEVPLVYARALDARDDLRHRVPDDPRVLAVERVARAQEDGVRTAAERFGRAHRRVDAEGSCRVVGRRHDAPPVRVAADDERPSSELGVLELLDRGKERVQVEVREDSHVGNATVGR